MAHKWEALVESVEQKLESLGIPSLAVHKAVNTADYMPEDPSNVSGKELANKLSEYSSYVSFLDAELGRIDAKYTAISMEFSDIIDEVALTKKISKPKAKAAILLSDPEMKRANDVLVELECLQKRMAGIRDGYNMRFQACSRELTRRSSEPFPRS